MWLAAAAHDREDALGLAARPQRLQDLLDLARLDVGIGGRRALRRRDRYEEDAAVLDRRQLLRQGEVEGHRRAPRQAGHQQHQERRLERPREQGAIAAGGGAEAALEQAGAGALLLAALQQLRAERRAERQRHHGRDRYRRRQHEAELGEQLANLPFEEGDRHEHRDQGERGRDHGERHLARAEDAGEQRALAALDPALDVLEHDDGVVDDDADRQDEGEQGQHVDGEAERVDADERADERHGDGHGRDHGRPCRGEEDEDHEHHEHHRDEERVEHLADRFADEGGIIRAHHDLHAFGQSRADEVDLRAHPVGDRNGVGL
jgi:hypothetical protein